MVTSSEVSAAIATRARIVLWRAEGRQKQEVAALAGVSRPTVDLWLRRFDAEGVAGLLDRSRGAAREQVPARIRARILALSRTGPPVETGLSHWSSREMARFITRTEGVYVSHHYVAKLWRETGIKPHQSGTFKVSKDPAFAEKVADVVGLYLEPPGGAVVLSIDEKTQIQALDRTQPVLPITFDATEKRTHDYVRHGTTNLFAALNVGNGQVYRRVQTHPQRRGLPGLLAQGGQAARRHRRPRGARQPVHAHHTGGGGLAAATTRTCTSTSLRSGRRGSTRSRPGSASSPASPSGAARSPPSRS